MHGSVVQAMLGFGTHEKESPTFAGLLSFQTDWLPKVVPSDPCLHQGCLYGILVLRTNNMLLAYHKTTSMLQIASPMHCESIGFDLRQNIKKAKSKLLFNRSTPRTDRQPICDEVACLHVRAPLVALAYIKSERAVTMGEINGL